MPRIPSSLNNADTAVNRNIDNSHYDNVKKVADSIEQVVIVSNDLALGDNSKTKIIADNIVKISTTADNMLDINTVADNISAVQDFATFSDELEVLISIAPDVTNVSTISQNVINVSAITDEVTNVSLISSSVVTTSNSIDKVITVSSSISDVNLLANNINDINVTSDYITNINTVATNIDEIIIDANNIGHIVTVSTDLNLAGWASILDAGAITDAIEMEETGISLIKTVATNIDDVSTVANSINSVVIASDNVAIMNVVGDNITDIQNAEENANIALTKANEALTSATNALNSETFAHKWAQELEDVPVTGTVGVDDEYSAYHWAKKAESVAGGNITLDRLYDVDTSGIVQGGLLRYDETTGWKAYDFTHNDKLGFDLTGSLVSTGEMAWNPDEGTLNIGLNNGSILQVGQENNRLVRNDSGSLILNGTVVMFDGTVGNSGRVKVKPYTGVKGTEMYIYGVTTQDILSGSDGYMTIEGKVRNINTTGSSVGETWLDGQVLYVKPNDNGRLTNVEPTGTEIKIEVATIINAHTNGTLEIRIVPIDRNFSYSRNDSDTRYVPLLGDFNLDLGGIV